MAEANGNLVLRKMRTDYSGQEPVQYRLATGGEPIPLNPFIGKTLGLKATGRILCLGCGKATKQSYSQGYCYECSQRLACTDMCIVRPELCHFAKGTCREPEWGQANCMIAHTLYLANSSGLKVGITRAHQRLTRWIDQGAIEAIPVINIPNRLDVGKLEVQLKEHFADKTNWRNMLKGVQEPVDLYAQRRKALSLLPEELGDGLDDPLVKIRYPVLENPTKIVSLNLEKTPHIEGTLQGIKGQYLIFDNGVINIRSYGGYEVALEAPN